MKIYASLEPCWVKPRLWNANEMRAFDPVVLCEALMRSRRFERKPPAGVADELSPEDGLDPRLQHYGSRSSAPNRKALQLAAQVERTLIQVFAGEFGDD